MYLSGKFDNAAFWNSEGEYVMRIWKNKKLQLKLSFPIWQPKTNSGSMLFWETQFWNSWSYLKLFKKRKVNEVLWPIHLRFSCLARGCIQYLPFEILSILYLLYLLFWRGTIFLYMLKLNHNHLHGISLKYMVLNMNKTMCY